MIHTYETRGARCPYCQHLHEADESYWYDEMLTEHECDDCGKTFEVRVYTSTSWSCEPLKSSEEQASVSS